MLTTCQDVTTLHFLQARQTILRAQDEHRVLRDAYTASGSGERDALHRLMMASERRLLDLLNLYEGICRNHIDAQLAARVSPNLAVYSRSARVHTELASAYR